MSFVFMARGIRLTLLYVISAAPLKELARDQREFRSAEEVDQGFHQGGWRALQKA
jgi:hypothetical protein